MILSKSPRIELIRGDCMDFMKDVPDKYYELAIVDPPYGIGYENGGQYFKNNKYGKKNWDKNIPNEHYFLELIRVSENQIIWGANYFYMPPTRCFLTWYKTDEIKDRTFSECEYAWTSFATPARHYELKPFQRNGSRIHPTQKPVKLYEWLLMNYAKQGDKILDTHLGSGSSAIAAYRLGFSFTGIEIDQEYYDAAVKRFKLNTSQVSMF